MKIRQFITGKCLMGKKKDLENANMIMEVFIWDIENKINNMDMEEIYFLLKRDILKVKVMKDNWIWE